MNTAQTLGQNLSQQLRLSPQLQQSLNILQAPVFELRQMIDKELVDNPVLEAELTETSLDQERPEAELERDDFTAEFDKLSQLDEEWRTYMQQQASATRSPRTSEDDDRRQFLFDSLSSPVTLQDHLMQQLAMVDLDKETRALVEMLIGTLDDRGFLGIPLGEMSLTQGLPLADLKRAKEVLHSFDPAGVGSDDLRESLLVQLKLQGREHSLEGRIVAAHLDDLPKRRLPYIARRLAVTPQEITRATEIIATLNPRPASGFSPAQQHYVAPDVTVEWSNGKLVVQTHDEQIPRLRISNLYKDIMARPSGGQEAKDYIREKIRSGKFLIRSIQQRQQTIHRIAEEIVAQQEEFFRHGPPALKPLNMAQVAEKVGVHETTISRGIAGKYMATPFGLREMRYFFTSGLATDDGESMSNTSVKTTLEELIGSEDTAEPLSDDTLAKQLQARGIRIARRTVAKYREAIGILPSHMRKKY